ncbi:UNVERIFIED_CONTAM: hypothetical protein FKN15_007943 [Acipenser sinensis]
MDRNALAELLQALESRRDAEERRREERYTALIERVMSEQVCLEEALEGDIREARVKKERALEAGERRGGYHISEMLLRSFTGWEVPDPLRVLMSQWRQNPYVRGAYTYIPLGVDAMREQEALAEPLPLESCDSISKPLQVLFAGEATHVQFYTTTHGAYLTGVREAQRIIQHYSDKLPSPNGERAS